MSHRPGPARQRRQHQPPLHLWLSSSLANQPPTLGSARRSPTRAVTTTTVTTTTNAARVARVRTTFRVEPRFSGRNSRQSELAIAQLIINIYSISCHHTLCQNQRHPCYILMTLSDVRFCNFLGETYLREFATKDASEISSINTNRKSTTRLPMSLRRT